MSGFKAPILLLIAIVFLAGMAAGVFVERQSEGHQRPDGPMEDYAQLLEQEFGLSETRGEHLRTLLEVYARDVDRVVQRHEDAYRAALEPDLRPLNEHYDRLVRDLVLPAHQRTRFDELAAGIHLNPKAN